jgi:hypothetical protein
LEGIENIFKLLRVDFVTAWQPGTGNKFGVPHWIWRFTRQVFFEGKE